MLQKFKTIRNGAAALTAIAMLAAGTLMASASERLSFYIYVPSATHVVSETFKDLAEKIGEKTGDEIQIALHLGGSLPIQASNITQAVADGVVDMGDDSFNAGNLKLVNVLRLPMLLSNAEDYAKALEVALPYIEQEYSEKGVTLLGQYVYPHLNLWSRKELKSLADIRNQKIRVMSPEQGQFVEKFGGVPVTMATPEVPPALDRGVVDGVITSSAGAGYLWKDLLSYNYRLGVSFIDSYVIINTSSFEKLTDEQQQLLRNAVKEAASSLTAKMEQQEASKTSEMESGGMTVTTEQAADLEEATVAMADYWQSWADSTGPKAVEVLDKVRAALGK